MAFFTGQNLNEVQKAAKQGVFQAFVNKDKIATGRTLADTTVSLERTENGYKMTITGPPQIQYIQEGRRPGTPPPLRPISEWLGARGLQFSVLFTARGIGKSGFEGVDLFGEIAEQVSQRISPLIESARVDEEILDRLDQLIIPIFRADNIQK